MKDNEMSLTNLQHSSRVDLLVNDHDYRFGVISRMRDRSIGGPTRSRYRMFLYLNFPRRLLTQGVEQGVQR